MNGLFDLCLTYFIFNANIMASFKIILRNSKAKPDGSVPLYLRVTHSRKTTLKSLGIYVNPKEWNEKKGVVYSSVANSARINARLSKALNDAQKTILDMEIGNATVSAKSIKNKLTIGGDFLAYFHKHVERLENAKKYGSHFKAKSVLTKLKEYLGASGLRFEEITVSWLKDYEEYLRDELGNSINTIHSNLKIIRKLFNDAVREDIINPNQNPFYKFKISTEKTSREYLTENELGKLEALDLNAEPKRKVFRDMYAFACYTGGIRISDLLTLKWKNFDGERINFVMNKTNEVVSVKVPAYGLEILNQYHDQKMQGEDFIFPLLTANDCRSEHALYRAISSWTAYANKTLREFATKVKIKKHLSFHTSRHTWATRALRKGMRIEYVSKLLGHSEIRTTQVYAKIVNEELDKAMDVFN